jgi:hypothetical protein
MFRIVQYTFSELDHDTLSELTQFLSSDATKFGMSPRIPILVEKRYGGVRISMELQDLTEVPQNLISSILRSYSYPSSTSVVFETTQFNTPSLPQNVRPQSHSPRDQSLYRPRRLPRRRLREDRIRLHLHRWCLRPCKHQSCRLLQEVGKMSGCDRSQHPQSLWAADEGVL